MIPSLLYGLAVIVKLILNMVMVLIFISILISWLNADPLNPYVRMVTSLTEPLYRPLRKLTGKIGGPIDFAPTIVLFIIIFLLEVLPRYLHTLARDLQ